MEEKIRVFIKDDFIKLGQAMKLSGAVESGAEAKAVIENGEVKVNGVCCTQRGKKLKLEDTFSYLDHEYQIHRTS